MRKNISTPQLNRALDQLQDFLELLPEFGKKLFETDDAIWITMDPEEQECMQTVRHLGKNSIVVKYENLTIKVIRMRYAEDGYYLYGFDDVFWQDNTCSARIREKVIEGFLNRDKEYFPLISR